MSKSRLDPTQAEAAKMFDAFISAITLPTIYSKGSVALLINEIRFQLEKEGPDMEEAELETMRHYENYLKTL